MTATHDIAGPQLGKRTPAPPASCSQLALFLEEYRTKGELSRARCLVAPRFLPKFQAAIYR